MPERILVCVAWPYANGSIHMGQAAGAYLPADIFARYHRLKGNDVLMISGSDSHGTPVTLEAEKRGVSPEEVFRSYHREFVTDWDRLGITFDLFTSTHTDNHRVVAQDIFLKLYENGSLYTDTMSQPFCENDQRFLADRYVEGICPNCDYDGARGDQCDNCGRTLDPEDLINMRCLICGNTPVIKETEQFFMRWGDYGNRLLEWMKPMSHWKPNVRNFSISYVEGGLKNSAVTRDIDWGIPVPIPGYENKRIYVWFEAVMGYLSASKEWAESSGDPDRWRLFWEGQSKAYYFMGKDNIPFHTIRWPAMLMGYGGLNLPYNIPSNEYLNLDGKQFSTSRNWAIWLHDYLDRYEPDPLRYVLAAMMPETSDSDFSWAEYVRRNNDELVATYGNLVHRVLTMSYRNFEGQIPAPSNLGPESTKILSEAKKQFSASGQNIDSCKFKAALGSAMALARSTNTYLDKMEPWRQLKTDRSTASTTLWVSLNVLNCLKIMLYPFLPFSSNKIHTMLGLPGNVLSDGWDWTPNALEAGQKMNIPEPLFEKLDEGVIRLENKRIGT